ncbi:MAG: GntR family transcriptional regulator [Mycobacterium leprae]
MGYVNKNGPVPIYYQIRSQILEAIEKGQLKPGDRVPSERELTERYGVSRMTVRQALVELESQGHLQRVQGTGTFVNTPKVEQPLYSLTSFTEDMQRRGLVPGSQLLSAQEVAAGRRAQQALAIGENEPVARVERLRLGDGKPMAIEVSHIPAALVPGLLNEDLSGSLYKLLRERYGLMLRQATQSLEAVAARPHEAKLLGVREGTPLLMLERVVHNEHGRPIEFAQSFYRGDRYRFMVSLLGSATTGA